MSDYIPLEMVSNILARLPVDDLLRYTSVCKSWYSLITSSHFISLHLKLSIPNQEPRVLVKRYDNNDNNIGLSRIKYSLLNGNQPFDEISDNICPPSRDISIIGSCNGVFCLAEKSWERIILWNPSIRKEVVLNYPRVRSFYDRCCIGFGFVPETNDYKIVIFSYLGSVLNAKDVPLTIDVYNLCTNSWRNLDNAADFCYELSDFGLSQAFLNGRFHWFARKYNNVVCNYKIVIASFDLSSENLSTLMLPDSLDTVDNWCYLFSFRESLCLIDTRGTSTCNIFVMKEYGVTESWEMQFSIPIPVDDRCTWPFDFQDDPKLLYWIVNKGLFSYDTITHEVDRIFERGELDASGYRYRYRYMESLVLIKHGKTTESNKNSAGCKSENRIVKEPRVKKKHSWMRFFICN